MNQDQPVPDDADIEAGQQPAALSEAQPLYRDPNDPSLHKGNGPVVRLLGFLLIAAVVVVIVWWRGFSSRVEVTAKPLEPCVANEAEPWSVETAITVKGTRKPEIVYSLEGDVPAECRIDGKSGLITWTPTEEQGPGEFRWKVVCRVAGVAEPVVRSILVTVKEVNRPPVVTPVAGQQAEVARKLSVTLSAKDPDLPKDTLTFELLGEYPPGASLAPETGLFTWTPAKGTPAGPHSVTVQVTDSGDPPQQASTTFEVRVKVPAVVSVPDPPPPPRLQNHYVFLVGVSGYRPRVGLRSLQFPERDVEELAKVFERRGVPTKNIMVMSASRAAKEYRFMPIAKHIKMELVQWLKFRKPGDRIILAFSGHGIQIGKVAYFCPADIDLRKPETMVSFETIYELLKLCPAEVKLLITDACRTNPFAPKTRDIIPGLESVTRPQAIPPPGGIAALFACAAGQAAWEDKGLGKGKPPGHGVFFHFLIEAFQGAADADKNGKITVTELHAYVAGKVEEYVSRKFGEKQTPTLKANLVGSSTILGATSSPAKPAPDKK
jgi:hypothetical protein